MSRIPNKSVNGFNGNEPNNGSQPIGSPLKPGNKNENGNVIVTSPADASSAAPSRIIMPPPPPAPIGLLNNSSDASSVNNPNTIVQLSPHPSAAVSSQQSANITNPKNNAISSVPLSHPSAVSLQQSANITNPKNNTISSVPLSPHPSAVSLQQSANITNPKNNTISSVPLSHSSAAVSLQPNLLLSRKNLTQNIHTNHQNVTIPKPANLNITNALTEQAPPSTSTASTAPTPLGNVVLANQSTVAPSTVAPSTVAPSTVAPSTVPITKQFHVTKESPYKIVDVPDQKDDLVDSSKYHTITVTFDNGNYTFETKDLSKNIATDIIIRKTGNEYTVETSSNPDDFKVNIQATNGKGESRVSRITGAEAANGPHGNPIDEIVPVDNPVDVIVNIQADNNLSAEAANGPHGNPIDEINNKLIDILTDIYYNLTVIDNNQDYNNNQDIQLIKTQLLDLNRKIRLIKDDINKSNVTINHNSLDKLKENVTIFVKEFKEIDTKFKSLHKFPDINGIRIAINILNAIKEICTKEVQNTINAKIYDADMALLTKNFEENFNMYKINNIDGTSNIPELYKRFKIVYNTLPTNFDNIQEILTEMVNILTTILKNETSKQQPLNTIPEEINNPQNDGPRPIKPEPADEIVRSGGRRMKTFRYKQ